MIVVAARGAFERGAVRAILRGCFAKGQLTEARDAAQTLAALAMEPRAILVVEAAMLVGAPAELPRAVASMGGRAIVFGQDDDPGLGRLANGLPARIEAAMLGGPHGRREAPKEPAPPAAAKAVVPRPPKCVLVAASTGGPVALERLLRTIPPGGVPWIVAQHLPADGAGAFAAHLAQSTGHDVAPADGRAINGGVHVLGGGGDFRFAPAGDGALRLRPAEADGSPFHPNADRLFASAAELNIPCIVIVMTGMGADGAEGAARLARLGAGVYVQDPATCVVPGMPSAALGLCPGAKLFDPAAPPPSLIRLCAPAP